MWFYKQVQRIPQTPQREVEAKNEPMQVHTQFVPQTPPRGAEVKIEDKQNHHAHVHTRENVHGIEIGAKMAERNFEHAESATDWFRDVMQPVSSNLEGVAEEGIEQMIDENGWWQDESNQ